MIDAYEIGIQLALQDGVSAGLQVIGRELAEVDRAIAATSAGLQQLTRAAEGAVGAAAAAARVSLPSVPRPEAAEAPSPGAPERASAPQTGEVGALREASVPSTPDLTALRQAIPQRMPSDAGASAAPQSDTPDMPAGQERQSREAAAPVQEPVTAPPVNDEPTPAVSAAPPAATNSAAPRPAASPVADAGPAAPVTALPALLRDAEPVRSVVRVEARVRAAPRERRAAPVATGPMTASVAQAVAPRATAERASGPAHGARVTSASAQSETARGSAAPWSGLEHRAAPSRSPGFLERAAAPQPQPRDVGESAGGTVVLDGRLVGYWLSEQMAREASRPPGGPSFFDPRQTPAWTVSGAI